MWVDSIVELIYLRGHWPTAKQTTNASVDIVNICVRMNE